MRRLRLTSRLKLDAVNQFEFWDARIGAIDDWPDVDGTLGASVDASIWGRLTDDDPAGSPSWGALMRIDSAIVDTTKHTHIRRNRIRLQTGSQQIVAIPL